ncbi:glycosyltransferase family 4 protein [Salinicoccus halodurans]|nr:glycosyltransferase family 4 protein [Salinicoccus halodurans]
MSLISLYTNFLESHDIDYDIIYIDKYQEDEKINAKNVYKYSLYVQRNWGFIRKLYAYWGFRNFAKSKLREHDYDHIVVWRSETALMFLDFLLKNKKKKYNINVRDYCKEKNLFVYYAMAKLIKNSLFTTISSEGFKRFLPPYKYVLVHSYNNNVLKEIRPNYTKVKENEPIKICFIGYVRFYEEDKKLIDTLGNDNRFILQFFGSGSDELKNYAYEKGIKNVITKKAFKVEETPHLLQKADVINNLYGNGNIALDTAISIKYYYTLKMQIPILVNENTYISHIAQKTDVGFIVKNNHENLADDFYNWYHNRDLERFKNRCQRELEKVEEKNKEFNEFLETIFIKGKYNED